MNCPICQTELIVKDYPPEPQPNFYWRHYCPNNQKHYQLMQQTDFWFSVVNNEMDKWYLKYPINDTLYRVTSQRFDSPETDVAYFQDSSGALGNRRNLMHLPIFITPNEAMNFLARVLKMKAFI